MEVAGCADATQCNQEEAGREGGREGEREGEREEGRAAGRVDRRSLATLAWREILSRSASSSRIIISMV